MSISVDECDFSTPRIPRNIDLLPISAPRKPRDSLGEPGTGFSGIGSATERVLDDLDDTSDEESTPQPVCADDLDLIDVSFAEEFNGNRYRRNKRREMEPDEEFEVESLPHVDSCGETDSACPRKRFRRTRMLSICSTRPGGKVRFSGGLEYTEKTDENPIELPHPAGTTFPGSPEPSWLDPQLASLLKPKSFQPLNSASSMRFDKSSGILGLSWPGSSTFAQNRGTGVTPLLSSASLGPM
eukprot:gene4119-749_t